MFLHKPRIIAAMFAFGMTITMLLMALSLRVTAQGDPTPTPVIDNWYLQEAGDWNLPFAEPRTSTGDAEWTIANSVFESDYPNGFTFSIDASSNKGEIILASVIWSHTPNKLKRAELSQVSLQSGHFTYRWYPDDSLPPWVAVNYYWSFADSAGNRYRTGWIVGNAYLHSDLAEWTRAESDDVIVFLQEGLPLEAIDLTFAAMADQRETYQQAWGQLLPYKPRAILFSNQRDFQEWRSGFGGSNVIGQTSEKWGATAQVIADDSIFDLAYGTVLHEVAHLYQLELAPSAFSGGSWFTEGNATLFELHQQYDYEARVRNLAADGLLPVLLEGQGPGAFSRGPDGIGRYGYDVGYTFWKWIVTNYGLDAHRQIIEGLAARISRNTVLAQVLGMPTYQIESTWALWLGASEPRPTPFPTYVFPPTVTPFALPTRAN
jgi:hypothetical protein